MVHRSADSRLLVNLLQNEKEYAKHLNNLQDLSNNSLASFAAYAAASAQPTSQVVLSVAGSLAAADEALRRYVLGVDEWREAMRGLKELEEEVGNIIRDREILVTRVIKASRSGKNAAGNIRDSLLLGHQTFTSASSLSLTSSPPDSPSPGASRPLSGTFSISIPTSTKLAAAQAELQACETHLAAKERELGVRRCTALRDGLGARMRAMAECGWAWGEIGKEAGRVLEGLGGGVMGGMGEGMGYDATAIAHDSRTSSPLVRNPSFAAAPPLQEYNGQYGSVPEPRMSHYMAGAEQQLQQQNHQPEQQYQQQYQQQNQYQHQQHQVQQPQQYQQQQRMYYPAAPEVMESPMQGFSALGPADSASQVGYDQQQQQQQQNHQQQGAPPPISILSLVDPGVAFGAQTRVASLGAAVQTRSLDQRVAEHGGVEGDTEEDVEADQDGDDDHTDEESEQQPTPIVGSIHTESEGAGSTITPRGVLTPNVQTEVQTLSNTEPEPTARPKTDVQTQDLDRPPSDASSGTNASSMYYTPVTPTTYTTETISYAPAIAVRAVAQGQGQEGQGVLGHVVDSVAQGKDEKPVVGQLVASQVVMGQDGMKVEAGVPSERFNQLYSQQQQQLLQNQQQLQNQPQQQQQQQHQRYGSGDSFIGFTSSTSTPTSTTIGGEAHHREPVSPYAPLTQKEYFEEDLHKSVRIPPAHAIGEYEMPVAAPTLSRDSSMKQQGQHTQQSQNSTQSQNQQANSDASQVKRNSLLMRLGSLGGGSGRSSSSGTGSAPHTPVVESTVYARHVLERRITEEEMRGGVPLVQHGQGKGQEVKEVEESDAESDEKWLGEGELKVVENPRFMSEERKRELARKKEKEEEEERRKAEAREKEKRKGKEKEKDKGKGKHKEVVLDEAGDETEQDTPKANKTERKRRISFVKHKRGAESQSTVDGVQAGGPSPTKQSPSKGFLGSIKGLFSSRHTTPPQGAKKADHRRTMSGIVAPKYDGAAPAASDTDRAHAVVAESDDDDDDDSEVEESPTKTSGFHLFGVGRKKNPGGVKEMKWETRTDRNLKKLEAAAAKSGGVSRKYSLDESRGRPVMVEGGGVERVMRTASVVANGSNASLLSDARNERDRKKLRKVRGGGVHLTEVVGEQQHLQQKQHQQQQQEDTAVAVRRHPSQATKTQQPKTGLTHRRSASIDVGVQQRRSFVENEARKTNAENEMRRNDSSNGGDDKRSYADAESDHGTVNGIVDLGSRRRRAASEVGNRLRSDERAGPSPPVPSHQPVPMGYVPTAPGSVLTGMHMGGETPRPIQAQPYIRPAASEVTSASAGAGPQRTTSILKTRKASSDVGPANTNTTTNAYSPPVRTQPPPPPIIQAQPSSSPPLSRRQSTRTVPTSSTPKSQPQTATKQAPASPPGKAPSASPTTIGRATVLPAGGGHPSGTLVADAGWHSQQQSALTGAISRNASVRSSASAPSGEGQGVPQSRGAGVKKQRQTVLGQGMPTTTLGAGVGRHASLGHASGGGLGQQQHQQQQQQYQQQQQHNTPPQSLLKIIEDVANVNKKGPMTGGIGIPSAPPRVLTEKLKAMDQDVFMSKVGASPVPGFSAAHGVKTKYTSTTTPSASQGLWEIKAPASVWDQRQALMEQHVPPSRHSGIYKDGSSSMSAPDLTSANLSRSRSLASPKPAAAAASGNLPNGHVESSGSGFASGAHPAKSPLRSAMRHPSRTPSPLVSGSPHIRAGSGPTSSSSYYSPMTLNEPLAAPSTSLQHQPSPLVREVVEKKDKGKGRAVEEPEDTGADSSAYETGNEAFYTDDESGAEGKGKGKGKKPIFAAPVPFSGPSHGMNGHAAGYGEYGLTKGTSDVSRSDTSTAHAGSASDHQQPRRRKSVRVSLKPTFSPSPPAIEYDDYEEATRHAPWAWDPKNGSSQYDSIEKRASEHVQAGSSHHHAIASPTPQAPARQHVIVKQQKAERTKDIWEDSSDEDEAYLKAKQALSEAAKFEKDVTLMVANRRF